MKIILAGSGSIALKHISAIQNIEDVEITTLLGADEEELKEVSSKYNIPNWSTNFEETIANPNEAAVILATPTPLHASQAIACMKARKHVLIEIPMADNLNDSREIVRTQKETGKVAMVAHTRRFNPPHQWIHDKINKGELHLHHLDVQTFFHRRENKSALGKSRNWSDHLLWHHACHSVDLFRYQTGEPEVKRWAMEGPVSPIIKVPLDMNIGMKSTSGKLLTVALSFNNEGPLGSWFRYICEEGTFKVRYNDMTDGWDKKVDYDWSGISDSGIELQDREFFEAIRTGEEPNASASQCYDTMGILHKLEYLAKN
ncbi:MAG: oxidoreductase [Flavobacteriaceae bacterium]|nr:MAG: oxidoreductase [Flavobacteriaceae bacterium]